MNRTGKSARNFLFTLLSNAAAVLIGLAAQKIFIRILGLEYSGLNGLFSNVIISNKEIALDENADGTASRNSPL